VKVVWDEAKNLAVVWTEMEDGAHRIISARWASEREKVLYQAYMDDKL
jgi:uncharacterized DUF497 family protein